MPALALGRGSVQAEEISLQADFHAILAEYVREHRLYAFHPDFELLQLRREDLDYPSMGPFRSSPQALIPGEVKEMEDGELESEGLVEKSMLKVLEDFLNHRKEFRRLVLLVTWLELLRERDLWMLRDEIDGLVGRE
ncbi:hypothetical protein Naga_100575g1 [Nannochloropsis gaditana]|uniref:Uncharacterized protein n=1 Tax=Nannochloropsis gaditana TaxID=72520 RepID=W7TZV1_9STRA|nr:hypothetical protein Naga_100575g1 [Nannochloropsis gaditana]